MPPSNRQIRKALGRNGQAGMSLQAGARGSRQSLPMRTFTMNAYMLDATLGRPLPRPSILFEDGLFQPDPPTPVYPVDLQRPDQVGGPIPRIWQYPIAWNLPTGPRAYEPVSFDTLRATANQVDPVRTAIQLIKDEVASGEWQIVVKDPSRLTQEGRNYKKEERRKIRAFFDKPDFMRGQSFLEWIKMLLEEMLVTDALSIYPRYNFKGELAALQIIDGATIKPLLDLQGGRPQAPAPAYQQYLYGVPRSEFAVYGHPELLPNYFDTSVPDGRNLSVEQLIYRPYTQRASTVYGLAPTEQVIQTAITWLRRSTWWQQYFTEGDIPATFIMGGEGWTPEQLERWESAMHSLMAGDPSFRWRLKAIPYGTSVKEMKMPNFDVAFDEFLLKLVAMTFRITSNELFGMSSGSGLGGRGFLEESAGQQDRKFVHPLRRWIETICNEVIADAFHEPDLAIKFNDNDMQDDLKQAQIDDTNIKNGTTFIDEVRESRGQPALGMPEATKPYIETRAGLTPLDKIDEFTEQLLAQGTGQNAGVSGSQGLTSSSPAGGNPGRRPGPNSGSPQAAKSEIQELENFAKFLQSNKNGRPFDFKLLKGDLREMLEKLAMNWNNNED